MDRDETMVYSLHAKLDAHRRQMARSLDVMRRGLDAMGKPYISMSFGKDSLVMAHLIWTHHPEIPMLYVNCGEYDEWPDTARVRREFLALFPGCDFTELSGPSVWSFYQRVGFYVQDEETTPQARQAQREYSDSLGKVLGGEARRRGFDGAFIGLRRDESYNRERLFRMRGNLYYAETRGEWACCPLERWTGRDVWAYIVAHDLPYNELYDLAPEGRELARNGAMFGSRSARYGRLVFIKRMYPDLFNRFAGAYPEVRAYV